MSERPKPFQVYLTPAEKSRLDEHRAALGKRSLVEVMRHWIAEPFARAPTPVQADPVKAYMLSAKLEDEAVERLERIRPAPGSRLKKR